MMPSAQLGGLTQASNYGGKIVGEDHILLLWLHEGVGDFLAAIGGRNEHDESATGNDQAQGASGLVARIVWIR